MQKRISILGNEFDLEIDELTPLETGDMRFASMDTRQQEIVINKDVDATWRVYLLVHEVLHTLTFLGHLQFLRLPDHPGIDDEAKVDAISSLLADVLVRNGLFNMEALDAGRDQAAT
jgi:hypothetical protein